MYGVWSAILNAQFTGSSGYITQPQDRHSSQPGRAGFSDLHTFQYRDDYSPAAKFLITQCKRPGLEGRNVTWAEGVNQLIRYLSATHGTRPQGQRTPVYGIVAIGYYMRVYKYDDVHQDVDDWAPPGLVPGLARSINYRTRYTSERTHKQEIQQILDYILAHH